MANSICLFPSPNHPMLTSAGDKAMFSPKTGMLSTSNGSYHLEKDKFLQEWKGFCGEWSVTINEMPLGIVLLKWW